MNAQTQTRTLSLNARHSGAGRNPVAQLHSREAGMTSSQAGHGLHAPDTPASPSWIPAFAGMTVGVYDVTAAHTGNGTP